MTPQPAAAAHLSLDPATTDETLATIFAAQRRDPDRSPAQLQTQREAGAALIAALRPRDPIEAAYAARATAAHYGAMECFRRAMLPDTPDNAALRWIGKAVALSRMNTDMLRTLRECQAATPRAQPQPQPQPAARSAVPPASAPAAAARPAAGIAAKPVGRQDPMPSERPSPAPSAGIPTTQPAADVAAMRAAATAQAAKPTGTQDPMSSERLAPAPEAAAVTARSASAAGLLSPPPPRRGAGAGRSGSSGLAGGRLAAAPA